MHDAQPESPDPAVTLAGGDGGPAPSQDSLRADTAMADGTGPAHGAPATDGSTPDGSVADGSAPAGPVADGPTADGTEQPELPVERPKSAYQLPTRENTVLRNIIWAMVLTMAVVVVIAIAFFGVGSDLEREPLENSEVDVAATAERAQDVAEFPVAVPAVGEDWEVRSARFTDGQSPAWTVQYTSPGGALVTLAEDGEISAPMLSAEMPGANVTEETSLEGADCQVLSGGEAGADRLGVACEGEGYGLLVHGATERAELEQLMSEALAAVG